MTTPPRTRPAGRATRHAQHVADIEAVDTYEGTDTVQWLLVGRKVTGLRAFA